jgi:hypothetical protein
LARRDASVRRELRRLAPLGRTNWPTVGAFGERRTSSTINAIGAAVTAFRVYHVRAGTMAGQIEYQLQMQPGRHYKPFLHHITKGRAIHTRIVKIKTHPPLRGSATTTLRVSVGRMDWTDSNASPALSWPSFRTWA